MKSYYNQEKIASSFYKFFSKFSLSKPHLKSLCFAIIGMIVAESVERRFRRFFKSFSSSAYSFYESFISYVISHFCGGHLDKNIHISFDHMFCKDKFTILLFSLRIGKQRYSFVVSLF